MFGLVQGDSLKANKKHNSPRVKAYFHRRLVSFLNPKSRILKECVLLLVKLKTILPQISTVRGLNSSSLRKKESPLKIIPPSPRKHGTLNKLVFYNTSLNKWRYRNACRRQQHSITRSHQCQASLHPAALTLGELSLLSVTIKVTELLLCPAVLLTCHRSVASTRPWLQILRFPSLHQGPPKDFCCLPGYCPTRILSNCELGFFLFPSKVWIYVVKPKLHEYTYSVIWLLSNAKF